MAHPIHSVSRFMDLGGQYFPNDTDRQISVSQLVHFLCRIEEEVCETEDAIFLRPSPDLPEILDGAIDTAYVALTLAIRLVGPEKARDAWDAVVDANLAKVDGRHGPAIIDPDTGKIGKPKGWTAPDIKKIMEA